MFSSYISAAQNERETSNIAPKGKTVFINTMFTVNFYIAAINDFY